MYPSMFTRRTRPFGGAGVVRGYSAAVLDELAAADNEGLGGDVGEAELEQDLREVPGVIAGPERGDHGGEAGVHVAVVGVLPSGSLRGIPRRVVMSRDSPESERDGAKNTRI